MQLLPVRLTPGVDPEIRSELILTATDLWNQKPLMESSTKFAASKALTTSLHLKGSQWSSGLAIETDFPNHRGAERLLHIKSECDRLMYSEELPYKGLRIV